MPFSFVVHPFSVTEMAQPRGNNTLFSYQDERRFLAAKMMNGGIAQPREPTPWITVTHSRFPGCTDLALARLSALVTTVVEEIWHIKNPVSSKL